MSNFKYFGHSGSIDDPFKFFQEQNYIICQGATDLDSIDDLATFYNERIVNSRKKYLRQSCNWEHHQKTSAGGLTNGFLNPHSFEKGVNYKFSDKILKILSTMNIQESLAEISGKDPSLKLFQTMFFDHNTTNPHQD